MNVRKFLSSYTFPPHDHHSWPMKFDPWSLGDLIKFSSGEFYGRQSLESFIDVYIIEYQIPVTSVKLFKKTYILLGRSEIRAFWPLFTFEAANSANISVTLLYFANVFKNNCFSQ